MKINSLFLFLVLLACTAGCPRPQRTTTRATPPTVTRVIGVGFESVADAAGLAYHWPKQPRPMRNLEAFGCGCAFLDYDDDGFQDILLVTAPHPILYHNTGKGTFEDVSAAMGLAGLKGEWKGVAVGDYDGDGHLDLVLTGYRCLALLKNEVGKHFTDVTVAAGLHPDNRNHWGCSAGFMDLAGKGSLDLVILNYVVFNEKEPQYCEIIPGIKSGCPPSQYKPEFAELWQNRGDGTFQDATKASGLTNTNGKALVVAFADINNDGRMDFYTGNDGMPAELMLNQGGLHFKNQGIASGVAYGMETHAMAAMGADWADYDRDGLWDLAVPGFSNEKYMVFHGMGAGLFDRASDELGIAGPTYKPLGFGTKWLDMDNDGWPDLVFANGHVYDNTEQLDPLSTFLQPLMLFHNEQGKHFEDLVPKLGPAVGKPILGRGLATGDFDNDGRMDILVTDYENQPMLLHNVSETGNHALLLDLRGAGKNRFAYGAQVSAKNEKEMWLAQVSPTSSYLSSSDPRVHLGLGKATTLETLTIRWLGGKTEVLHHVAADQLLRIEEGKGIVRSTKLVH